MGRRDDLRCFYWEEKQKWSADLNFSFQRNKVNTEDRDRRMDGEGDVLGRGGLQPPHPKKNQKPKKIK